MVNKKEKILKDINYKEEIEKPKKEKIKTRISKNNRSVCKNSNLDWSNEGW